MGFLYMGLDKRVIQVTEETSSCTKVSDADKLFYSILESFNLDYEQVTLIEDAMIQLRFCEAEAGYRIGVSDGMQFQQQVNALIIK